MKPKLSFSLKKNNYLLTFAVSLILTLFLTGFALASTADQMINGFDKTSKAAGYTVVNPGSNTNVFAKTWSNYINGFLLIIGAFFVILMIYCGFLWLTARGREEQVTRAKTWMIQATIGLAIIIGARILVELVLFYLGQAIKP